MNKKAAIIGGSMAGLFAANFLQRINWDYTIHEIVSEPLSGRGAGIATYNELAELVKLTTGFNKTLGTKCSERIVLDDKNNIIFKTKYPQVFTSWQYLYDILLSNINKNNYFLGDECINIIKNNNETNVKFKNGKVIKADLVIIANGIRSKLKKLVDNNEPEFAGYIGWRGLVDERNLSKKTFDLMSEYFCFVLPQNQQFLTYPVAGSGQDGLKIGKRRINWLWYKPITNKKYNELLIGKSGKIYEHGIPPQEIKDEFILSLKDEAKQKLPNSGIELLEKTEQILIQPIYDLRSERMVKDNLITIGDCAFTARPHAGMGVTKAALDCFDLVKYLSEISENNLNDKLKIWQSKRVKEGFFLVNKSREMGSYITNNADITMPENKKVLEETAVSISDIKNYPNKINLFK